MRQNFPPNLGTGCKRYALVSIRQCCDGRLIGATQSVFIYSRNRWSAVALFMVAALLTFAGRLAFAHEVNPSPRPLLPACYEADLRCSLPAERYAVGLSGPQPLPTLVASEATTATVQAGKVHDGKWLQLLPSLAEPTQVRALRSEPLYDVPCVDGFAAIYPCNNVDLLAHLPYEMIGGKANNDSWGWRDPLDGREYALIGARDGVVILDITTPDAPFYLGKLPTHGTSSSWRDLKVYQDHLFVVADYNPEHGMQVFDLRTLRTLQRASAPLVLHESAHYAGFEDAHNLAINEASGFAYIVGSDTCDGGLHMVDIRHPTVPVGVGCYAGDGYIHDTTCVTYAGPDPRYQGNELCFNASVTEFTIVDVTDKANPTRIATYSGPGNAYIHQGWLTADQRYYVMNDELDELRNSQETRTYIINVATVDAPALSGIYHAPLTSIDHNLYISDTYIYEANYTTGLRLLDGKALPEGVLTEVASFDTFPEHDGASFDGAWTAYPYFRDGTVVVSTIESGVFILKPHLQPDVVVASLADVVSLCRSTVPAQSYYGTVALTARNNYSATAMLRVDGVSSAAESPQATALQTMSTLSATVTISPTVVDLHDRRYVTSTIAVDLATLATGTNTITVAALSPEQVVLDRTQIALHLVEGATALSAVDAVVNTIGARHELTLSWAAVADARFYQVEVATDLDFHDMIYRAETTATYHRVAVPVGFHQRYYWRVSPVNGCGVGVATTGSSQTPHGLFLPFVTTP